MQPTGDVVVELVDAAIQSRQLQSELEEVWRDRLADPEAAVAIAVLLKADVSRLHALSGPPVDVEQSQSGASFSDIVVMAATWVATDIALKALADLGKDAVKDALRKLWNLHLKPALDRRQPTQKSLGDEKYPD